MATIERKLAAMGLTCHRPYPPPSGVVLPFPEVNIRGDRAYVSGCGALCAGG